MCTNSPYYFPNQAISIPTPNGTMTERSLFTHKTDLINHHLDNQHGPEKGSIYAQKQAQANLTDRFPSECKIMVVNGTSKGRAL